MSAQNKRVTANITAQNTWTPGPGTDTTFRLNQGESCSISIVDNGVAGGGASTFVGSTVTLQRRFWSDAAADWRDVATYTTPAELGFFAETGMEIRVGVKTGQYTANDNILLQIKSG